MAVFRVERNAGYTVMSNHHLRNKNLTLKAKGLLSQMLSLPDDWDFTLAGLSYINREKIDAIREAIRELEKAGYIVRSRERDEKGRLRGADYVIYEQPQQPMLFLGGKEKTTLKEISEILGKETIDSFNKSENRGREVSHGLNFQKLGKELMTQDEIVSITDLIRLITLSATLRGGVAGAKCPN